MLKEVMNSILWWIRSLGKSDLSRGFSPGRCKLCAINLAECLRSWELELPVHVCVPALTLQSLRRVRLFVTSWTAARQASLSPPTPRVYSNSCPLSRWCHPTISSSVIPFASWLQSFPVSESFLMSQVFESGGQSTGVSGSASVLSKNIQDRFPLGLTGLISSLQSKGLSRLFSNTTIQKHQFFSTQLSLWSNSHIHTWLLEKP